MKVVRLSLEITTVAATRGRVYVGTEELVVAAAKHEAEVRGFSCNVYNKAASRLDMKYELGGIPGGDKVPEAYFHLDHLLSSKRYAGRWMSDPDNINLDSPAPLRAVDEIMIGGFFEKTIYGFGSEIPEETVCSQGFMGLGVQTTAYVLREGSETDLVEGDILYQDNQGVTGLDYSIGGWFWVGEPDGLLVGGTRFRIPFKDSQGPPGLILPGTMTVC
jgi:hypothetical protein